ncbi:MAG: hypothetical protein CSB47_06245 [Proteobacteria bacterium]|nr:MAG: hypothetical protein CSB47_06245 [Pseudomonadota bacterium]
MPNYQLSPSNDKYTNAANPPKLDRVVFTIDHIHAGGYQTPSTYEVVKYLVDRKIPVAVFFQATSPSNNYEFDRTNARMLYNLAPHLVSLGVHPLPKGYNQSQHMVVFNLLNNMIKDITGKKTKIMSYHGAGAGPMPGIHFPGIEYARGIGSHWTPSSDDPLDTPVMVLNSVKRAFHYTTERNAAGLSSTLFIHTNELKPGSVKKQVFDTFVSEVLSQRLRAQPYYEAMCEDFNTTPTDDNGGSGNSGGGSTPTTPSIEVGSLRLSASEAGSRRPLKANFKIQTTNGKVIKTASNVASELFIIPVGTYKVSATARGQTKTKTITLTRLKGLHHIFLIPNASGSSGSGHSGSSGTGLQGSLRLSASDRGTRRPLIADFLVQDLSGRLIQSATNTASHLFRLPPGDYQVSAVVNSVTASNDITLTATQGIHHIFLIPQAGIAPTPLPTPPPTQPVTREVLGSLRLSASDKNTRRPMKADFIIENMAGKLVDTAANVTSSMFRIPAGRYRVKAHSNGRFVSDIINLPETQGMHHIFLIPS